MTLLDSSTTKDGFDMFATISFESARQLLDLFDFPTAIAVLEDAPAQHEFDQHDSIKLQTAKAIVLTKAGEVCAVIYTVLFADAYQELFIETGGPRGFRGPETKDKFCLYFI